MIFHHQSHIWQKLWVSSYEPKCCQPIKLQDSLKCNISRKKWMMKFIFGIQINIEVWYKLVLPIWVSVTRHAKSTQNKFAYLCIISRKAWGRELIFCPCINANVFYKLLVSLRMCIARHAQSIQSSMFTISLQFLKENVKNEVDFLPADKRQRFIQSDIII